MIDELTRLTEEYEMKKADILRKQRNCIHEWTDPIYDPAIKREGYGLRFVRLGSDSYYEPEGYRDVKIPRWSRQCKLCGKVEYTDKQKPIVKEYVPDFS